MTRPDNGPGRRLIRREIEAFLFFIPRFMPGRTGGFLRRLFFKSRLRRCGRQVSVGEGVWIKGFENICLGDHVGIGPFCSFLAESYGKESFISVGDAATFNAGVMVNADVGGTIRIDDDVMVGPYAVIRASGHRHDRTDIPIRDQGHDTGTIAIQKGAWIGAHAVILPGITIGENAIVGAGAVVTRDVRALEVVGGVPARSIKDR